MKPYRYHLSPAEEWRLRMRSLHGEERAAVAADHLRMALLLFGSALGFGVAAYGTARTSNLPGAAAAGGFAGLCLILAIRNLRRWASLKF